MKFHKKSLFPVLLFLYFFAGNGTCYPDNKEITIVYTGNAAGKLRACNCPGNPNGGLAERVTEIKKLREKYPEMILIDAGNNLGYFGDFILKTSAVTELMNIMGYDAAGAGSSEFFHGAEKVDEILDFTKFPLISTNIVITNINKKENYQDRDSAGKKGSLKGVNERYNNIKSDGFELFSEIKSGNITACVLSVCDSTVFLSAGEKKGFTLISPEKALEGILPRIKGKYDLVILISMLSRKESHEIAKKYPEINLILEGNTGNIEKPIVLGSTIDISIDSQGGYAGVLTLDVSAGKITVKDWESVAIGDKITDEKARFIINRYYTQNYRHKQ